MAREGMLPKVFGKISKRTRAPWVAIIVCASGWALCLGLGFQRLITLDIMLYGFSLMLEFVTLVVLRLREPELNGNSAFRAACREPSSQECFHWHSCSL